MIRLFALISCSLFGIWCQQARAQDSAISRLDSLTFLEQSAQKKALLIDVRTKTEFKQGHLKGAKQVDFF
jgi:predicted sulfurtransferase